MRKILSLFLFAPLALAQYGGDRRTQSIWYVAQQDSTIQSARNARTFNVRDSGAVGNGVANDAIAIQRALTAASAVGGTVVLPLGNFLVNDTLLVTGNNVTIEGTGGTITQTTAGCWVFRVSGSGVRFHNVTIVGDTNGVYDAGYDIGIFFNPGTSNQTVENCNLSRLQIGVYGVRVNGLTVKNSYIHDVYKGISGGYNYTEGRDTIPTAFLFDGNRIHCAFGGLTYSRPLELLFGTHYRVINNELRGGGMSFEALNQGTADTNRTARIVAGNDCDTPISTGNSSIITNNIIDLLSAPPGRGMLSGYTQAIEGNAYTLVQNNVVRNFPVAVAGPGGGSQITGNYFESCGDTSLLNAFGTITLYSSMIVSPGQGVVISNNTFRNSKIADIVLNTNTSDTLRGVIVSSNYSFAGHHQFLVASNVLNMTITGNYVQDACTVDSTSGLNTTTAWGVWEAGATTSYYDANTFINTYTNGYGMYEAINPTEGAVIGFTRTRGIRNPDPILLAGNPHIIGKTEVDGVLRDLQSLQANALIVNDRLTLQRDTTTAYNPVLYLDGMDTTGAGTIVWYRSRVRSGVFDWALLTDPADNEIHFYDYHGSAGRRFTLYNVSGNAKLYGNFGAANLNPDASIMGTTGHFTSDLTVDGDIHGGNVVASGATAGHLADFVTADSIGNGPVYSSGALTLDSLYTRVAHFGSAITQTDGHFISANTIQANSHFNGLANWQMLNKVGNAWLPWGTRNTSGSEAVLDLAYIGTATAAQFRLSALNTAPANAGDTGTLGEIRIVDGFIYVAVGVNTWKRCALTTW